MHTKDMLAQALRDVGLTDLADRAATGYYHDYLSPLDMPEIELMRDMARAAALEPDVDKAKAIIALRERAKDGEFDASLAESEEWAASPEGQYAFSQLLGKKL
jgi:hypothetical protein